MKSERLTAVVKRISIMSRQGMQSNEPSHDDHASSSKCVVGYTKLTVRNSQNLRSAPRNSNLEEENVRYSITESTIKQPRLLGNTALMYGHRQAAIQGMLHTFNDRIHAVTSRVICNSRAEGCRSISNVTQCIGSFSHRFQGYGRGMQAPGAEFDVIAHLR